MKTSVVKFFAVLSIMVFLGVTVLELDAFARAGGGGSSGSRGSRSFSSPGRSYSQPSPSRQQPTPAPQQPAPQPGGGFLRSLGGGILGGMIGGMLFRSLGFGGAGGGFGGGGIGLFEIILIAGIGFVIYKMVRRNRENQMYNQSAGNYATGPVPQGGLDDRGSGPSADSIDEGLANLRQTDPSFDTARFNDTAMDIFFKIQGAWMNRDLSSVTGLLTEEMRGIFQKDIDKYLQERKLNRLENIAVRQVEPVEIWQESGQDFVTVRFYANLLDYTTDDTTGAVTAGSKTEPVKFEEFWTFNRPVGNNPWRLSAITQA